MGRQAEARPHCQQLPFSVALQDARYSTSCIIARAVVGQCCLDVVPVCKGQHCLQAALPSRAGSQNSSALLITLQSCSMSCCLQAVFACQAVQAHDARALRLSKANNQGVAPSLAAIWHACRLPSRPRRAPVRVRIPQTPYCAHAPTTFSSHTTSITRCVDAELCPSTINHCKPLPTACSRQTHTLTTAATMSGLLNSLPKDAFER